MKRRIALLLPLFLLLTALPPALGETFHAEDEADALRKALELFRVCALSAEYGDNRGFLIRWEAPIRVCTDGRPAIADLRELDAFLAELSGRVPGLPPFERVCTEAEANLVIHYCALKELPERVTGYTPGNWGYFSYWYTGAVINRAIIGIAVDKCGLRERNHLMREELVGALGLTNDHEVWSDSILYQPWTTVQTLSEVDWLMLNILYSPQLKPGDTWLRVRRVFGDD